MVIVLGQNVEVTTERQCRRSATDHIQLRNSARVDRQKMKFDVENSFVLCMQCGQAVPLAVDRSG